MIYRFYVKNFGGISLLLLISGHCLAKKEFNCLAFRYSEKNLKLVPRKQKMEVFVPCSPSSSIMQRDIVQ